MNIKNEQTTRQEDFSASTSYSTSNSSSSSESQSGSASGGDILHRRYLRMAFIWSENSYCQRRQVGALIVKDKMIISDGYNGTPSGFENVCEEGNVTKPYVLHAEANAITKIARSGNNSDGATLYVTDSPCIECAKLIIQAGIHTVVFSRSYRLTDGIDLLRRAGIEVIQIEENPNNEK
ncbi:MAG: dCMP deaminase family protein [Bacteroidaceae bacterium]|nr:dCMP deaminase family protein [Bacteroidaceae bacterium]